ncbi:hypothetical protein ACFV2U_40425 [Streptomyces sp. NPDC059697]|uniref:hypothetical protein n=1 Tax=Streptomyces sp. NPDC059697 TaxID=3346912 RepID=UPI0036958739
MVVVTAVCAAHVHRYWADDPQVGPQYRNAALRQVAEVMAAPILLICWVLADGLRGRRGLPHRLLAVVAWVTSVPTTALALLFDVMMNDSNYCTA